MTSLWGQGPVGIPAKAAAKEYDASAEAGKMSIGAIYMGRSFAALPKEGKDKQRTVLFDAVSFLVVELGVFAAKGAGAEIHLSDFNLRIDGQKAPLAAIEPGQVFKAIRAQGPPPPRMMSGGFPTGEPPPEAPVVQQAWDAALESALAEGRVEGAKAGNLFFAVPNKTNKIKTVVLEYSGGGGVLEIKLR